MMTVIGRVADLRRFGGDPAVDTWLKTGRIPRTGEPPVIWAENLVWLEERIVRGDAFGLATDPAALPSVRSGFVPGSPNGYFTARERDLLNSRGIPLLSMW